MEPLVLLGLSTRAVDSARQLNLDISSSALVGAVALPAPVDPNTKGMVSAGLVDIKNLWRFWATLILLLYLGPHDATA